MLSLKNECFDFFFTLKKKYTKVNILYNNHIQGFLERGYNITTYRSLCKTLA